MSTCEVRLFVPKSCFTAYVSGMTVMDETKVCELRQLYPLSDPVIFNYVKSGKHLSYRTTYEIKYQKYYKSFGRQLPIFDNKNNILLYWRNSFYAWLQYANLCNVTNQLVNTASGHTFFIK
jgi:hypothetical protein